MLLTHDPKPPSPIKSITSTAIHEVIKEAKAAQSSIPNTLQEILNANGLGKEEIISNIGSLVRFGETEQIRIKAAEIGLKLNGLLQTNQQPSIPVVNIIINDSEQVNQIFFPR